MLFWILGGLLFGAAVVVIAYTVAEIITKSKLPNIIRKALANDQSEKAKQLLASAIEAQVKAIDGNTITLEAFESSCSKNEKVEIKITGTGIDSSLSQKMTIYA